MLFDVLASDEARLFEPFSSTRPDGTGMGLAIGDTLVAEPGGHIAHSSSAGRTRFTLTLPNG